MSPTAEQRKVQIKTWLPRDLKATFDILLADPLTGRAAAGAWTRLFERLLRKELASMRGQLRPPLAPLAPLAPEGEQQNG